MHVQGDSYGGLLPLLSPSPTMVPCFSCGPRPSPRGVMAFYFPALGTLLLIPLGCLHTTNPRPLTRTDLLNLSLSTQPPPKPLRLWCPGAVVQMICVALTLLCPPQSSCCAFLSNFEVLLAQLISPSVRGLPRIWVPCLLHSSLSGMLVLS